ncbi:Histidine kinase [Sediminibacterium ginsengisoli]|uniref:Histidine kinase n=2 Tax=Sediminibacterium ginsengisoli TaxID=413434 RepID=A0A1T4LVE1_9BACT|nr:Histidine kinase [Sediminibacterium ginsengisoli]
MPKQQEDILITIVIASVFLVLIGFFLLLTVFVFLRRQRKFQQEKDEMKNKFDQTILKTQLEIQEQTFTHISREIHDNIGQILSLVRLNLSTFSPATPEDKFEHTDQLLGKAIKDLRDLSHSLQTNRIHDIGIIESIRQLMITLEKTGRYKTSLKIADTFTGIDKDTDLILFRMIQEIVNNILKHAGASSIDMEISGDQHDAVVRVSDNGSGFDTEKLKNAGMGIGLQNIFSRAKMIHASVDIKSAPGMGTAIILHIKPK